MEASISILSQKIVAPAEVEKELFQIWDSLTKENKIRANLFNLIVMTPLNERYDYVRMIVQNLIEKFPCRILFITTDSLSNTDYYKTAVSVVLPDENEPQVACDNIDIAVGGKDIEKVPYLIFPHLLPDLPIYLLWPQTNNENQVIFKKLQTITNRIIFDSEVFDTIHGFANFILEQITNFPKIDIADLNWIHFEYWKNCIAAEFYPKEKWEKLKNTSNVEIHFNHVTDSYFSKTMIQSMYLQAWLASIIGLDNPKIEKHDLETVITYSSNVAFRLIRGNIKSISAGSILKIIIQTKDNEEFSFSRNVQKPEDIKIEIKNLIQCELPYHYLIGKTETGFNLSDEITNKGTSAHFVNTLKLLSKEKND